MNTLALVEPLLPDLNLTQRAHLEELRQAIKSEKMQAFAEHYVANGGNGTQAIFDAQYQAKNENSANQLSMRNLKRREIIDYIEALRGLMRAEVICEARDKRRLLWNIATRCGEFGEVDTQVEEYEQDGVKVRHTREVHKVFDPKSAISAVAELNRMDGDHAPLKTDNTHTFSIENALLALEQRRSEA